MSLSASSLILRCSVNFKSQLSTSLDELQSSENVTLIENIQRSLKCCGSRSADDWLLYPSPFNSPYPTSCCDRADPCHGDFVFTQSCYSKISQLLEAQVELTGILGLTISFILLTLSFCSCFPSKACKKPLSKIKPSPFYRRFTSV